MKVFISWSGERSHQVAIALGEWLPLVLHYVKPFVSSEHIEKGQLWGEKLKYALKETQFGIVCATPENPMKPWLLFEAGALSNAMASDRVAVLLYQCSVSTLSGPLQRFQATSLEDKDDFRKLVLTINNVWPDPREEKYVNASFDLAYPILSDKIKAIPAVDGNNADRITKDQDPNAKILEEIFKSLHNLEVAIHKQDDKTTVFQDRSADLDFRTRHESVEPRMIMNRDVLPLFIGIERLIMHIRDDSDVEKAGLIEELHEIYRSFPKEGIKYVSDFSKYDKKLKAFLEKLKEFFTQDGTLNPNYGIIRDSMYRAQGLIFGQ
jgi:hypothetical protein